MIAQKSRPLIFISVILVVFMMPILIDDFNGPDQVISKRPEQPAIAPVDHQSYYQILDWIIDGTHESDILFAGFNYSVFVNIKNLDTLNHSNLVLTLLSNSSYLTLASHVQNILPCLITTENQTIFVGNATLKKSVATWERAMLTLYITDDSLQRQEFRSIYNLRYYYLIAWSSIKWIPLDGDLDFDFESGESFAMDVNITNQGMKPAFNIAINISTYYGGRIVFWSQNRSRTINVLYPNQTVTLLNTYVWRFTVASSVKNQYEILVLRFRINGLDEMTSSVSLNLNPSSSSGSNQNLPFVDWITIIVIVCTFLLVAMGCIDHGKGEVFSPRNPQIGPIRADATPPKTVSNAYVEVKSESTSHQTKSPGENNLVVREYSTLAHLTEENQNCDIQIARLIREQNFEKALAVLEVKQKNLKALWKEFQGLSFTKTRSNLRDEIDHTRHQILNVKASCLQNQVNSATSLADYRTIGDLTRELIREVRQFIVERREIDTGLRSWCEMLYTRLKELLETNDYALRYYLLEARYNEIHENIVKKQFFGELLSMPSLDEDLSALILDLKHSASKSEMQRDFLCAAEALQIKVEILPQQMDLKISNLITCKIDPTFNQSVEEGFPRLKIAKINLLGTRLCRYCFTERVDGAIYCPNCGELLDA